MYGLLTALASISAGCPQPLRVWSPRATETFIEIHQDLSLLEALSKNLLRRNQGSFEANFNMDVVRDARILPTQILREGNGADQPSQHH
jgi:hypothetical protein